MTRQVPRFLDRDSIHPDSRTGSYSGVFAHSLYESSVKAHVRWWPCASTEVQTVLIFIPGNPGLIDFYTQFLTALHDIFHNDGLEIYARALLGHTPSLPVSQQTLGLLDQVEASVEFHDAVRTCCPGARVVIVSHSFGSWIASQVLKARPHEVDAVLMLCPTLSNIARTPNGRRLSWLLHKPIVSILSQLSILFRPISAPILSLLFHSWPADQRAVLGSFLSSPQAIFASLSMARDEMRTITAPDISLLTAHSSKLWLYYSEKDNWVGGERETIISLLGELAPLRIVHDKQGVPHAFCILHSDVVAAQCARWLREGGFIDGSAVVEIWGSKTKIENYY